MNTDIRISISFRGHRKRKKLELRLGPGATGYLIDLWIAAAIDRPGGVLTGLDDIDIALMAGWAGDPAELVGALVDVGLLDRDEAGILSVHDWAEHNGYASAAAARSEAARKAAKAKWDKRLDPEICDGNAGAEHGQYDSNAVAVAPSPTPSPFPAPLPLPPIKPVVPTESAPTKLTSPDDEWMAQIRKNPAYHGIDIDRELGKMEAWCGANRKKPTRKRFVNWLNNADIPFSINGKIVSFEDRKRMESAKQFLGEGTL